MAKLLKNVCPNLLIHAHIIYNIYIYIHNLSVSLSVSVSLSIYKYKYRNYFKGTVKR